MERESDLPKLLWLSRLWSQNAEPGGLIHGGLPRCGVELTGDSMSTPVMERGRDPQLGPFWGSETPTLLVQPKGT